MFIAYNIPPDSVHPALTDDVFEGRLPAGDYFYYVACAEADVLQSKAKQSGLVSLNRDENRCIDGERVREPGDLSHEVRVCFGKDYTNYGQSIIDYEMNTDYNNFSLYRKKINADTLSVQEFMDETSHSDQLQYKIDNGANWASTALVQDNEFMCAEFEYVEVEDGRLIHIRSRCRSRDTIIGDLINPWLELIDKYENMPMNIFSGAEHW